MSGAHRDAGGSNAACQLFDGGGAIARRSRAAGVEQRSAIAQAATAGRAAAGLGSRVEGSGTGAAVGGERATLAAVARVPTAHGRRTTSAVCAVQVGGGARPIGIASAEGEERRKHEFHGAIFFRRAGKSKTKKSACQTLHLWV